MADVFTNLWESVFTLGTTPTLLLATNVTFALLQLTLATLHAFTPSIHLVTLSFLCAGLWWSINWFADEVRRASNKEGEGRLSKDTLTLSEGADDKARESETEDPTANLTSSLTLSTKDAVSSLPPSNHTATWKPKIGAPKWGDKDLDVEAFLKTNPSTKEMGRAGFSVNQIIASKRKHPPWRPSTLPPSSGPATVEQYMYLPPSILPATIEEMLSSHDLKSDQKNDPSSPNLRGHSETTPAEKRKAFENDPHGRRSSKIRIQLLNNIPTGVLQMVPVSIAKISRNEGLVLKCGPNVRIEESLAQQFAESIGVPVPAVRALKTGPKGTVIVMDFVEGECLEHAWPAMSPEQKRSIADQVKRIVSTMRQANPIQSTIGSIDGPVHDMCKWFDRSGGPFHSEADLNEFVVDVPKEAPAPLREAFVSALPTDSRIVFSHGDICPRNIMVKDGHITALLDWEYAGWYPEYWEYVKHFDHSTDCKDWKDYANLMFETRYPNDLVTYQALGRWQLL